MADDVLEFNILPDRTTIADTSKTLVAEFISPETISEVTQSEDRNVLLCRLSTLEARGGSNSNCLIVVKRKSNNAPWIAGRFMKDFGTTSDGRRCWVEEIAAVSDDGTKAFVKIAEMDAVTPPSKVLRSWQTWDIEQKRLLSMGLNITALKGKGSETAAPAKPPEAAR